MTAVCVDGEKADTGRQNRLCWIKLGASIGLRHQYVTGGGVGAANHLAGKLYSTKKLDTHVLGTIWRSAEY